MIIPPQRNRYLAEITETITQYNEHAEAQVAIASKLYQLDGVKKMLQQD
jgi:methylmalonyl-CoA mutase